MGVGLERMPGSAGSRGACGRESAIVWDMDHPPTSAWVSLSDLRKLVSRVLNRLAQERGVSEPALEGDKRDSFASRVNGVGVIELWVGHAIPEAEADRRYDYDRQDWFRRLPPAPPACGRRGRAATNA
jgi:hypothetical protein